MDKTVRVLTASDKNITTQTKATGITYHQTNTNSPMSTTAAIIREMRNYRALSKQLWAQATLAEDLALVGGSVPGNEKATPHQRTTGTNEVGR